MTNKLLNIIKGSFPLAEIDCGEFSKMKVSGMNFEITAYTAKQEKARVYVNGLLEKGGPSTDVFKKSIGEAKTRELFERILFGTKY